MGILTSRIGKRVRFGEPRDAQSAGGDPGYGSVVDEVWADEEVNKMPPRPRKGKDDWGDYSFCAQLIKWSWGDHSIRLAYYRRRPGENVWRFASQTSVSGNWWPIKALLEKTLAKKHWFSDKPKV